MSITSLRKAAKEAKEAHYDACVAWKKDPEVVRLRKALREAEVKAQKANRSKVEKAEKAWMAAEKALDDAHKKKEEKLVVPEHIQDIVKRCLRGTDYGPKGLVVEWVSESGRFAIILQPEHAFWANMMEPNKYAPAERSLLDAGRDHPDKRGTDLYREVMVKEHEGRFLKAVKQEWMSYIEQEES